VRDADGAFVLEGARLLSAALDSGRRVESVFLAPQALSQPAAMAVVDRAMDLGSRVFELDEGVLEKVADTTTPQPVLAVAAIPDHDLGDLDGAGFVVVMVDVRDPGNAGTVIRSADAAGADAVVCCEGTVDPFNPKTVRSAAGSLLHLPVIRQVGATEALEMLGDLGFRRYGAVPRGGLPHTEVDFSAKTALVLGNESAGLDENVEPLLDGGVTIAMNGKAESLNVSMAATVLCFEVSRQRSNLQGAKERA
jgi:TrmH family RNA methyltransferase